MTRRQGVFWLLTIPHYDYLPYLPPGCVWLKCQLESGSDTGYLHWQCMVGFAKKESIRGVKAIFGDRCHGELSRSESADAYVWKDETAIPNTRYEFGCKPIRRNAKVDWESVWEAAKSGNIMAAPPSIRVQSYRTLRAIAADFEQPIGIERTCYVFWGRTGTGKSRRAWAEAGLDAYSKDPRTKFWCGYQSEKHVVVDEFRGGIDIAHLLRWLDRYPVRVEVKGSSRPLSATTFWITSNLDPRNWYPEIDSETLSALLRRLNITHFN